MPTQRRALIEDLFEAALDRKAGERDAFMEEACGGDESLLLEVRSLLGAHQRAEGVLELAPAAVVEALAGPLLSSGLDPFGPGDRIGPWRLMQELGHGGMAVVHLAERADGQFRQRVAIKVIRGFGDPRELERRFRAERQILATLDHPSIARLLDGGLTPDHRPYLVMEYVNGLPVDDYCDRRRLTVEERLRLFCTIGRAVQHAHRQLVVHRDLKPSNILVKGDGEVKLLDFGIAKILDPAVVPLATTPRTRTGVRLMTPEYASPEQIRGASVSTANDVYALGIVLYELLTGHRPFRMEGLSPGECERLVLHQEPPKPSTTVSRAVRPGRGDSPRTPTPELLARDRRTSPRRLRWTLEGDLDRIVLMALRKEPERRYASVEQMVEDVERHLDGRPVRATGDSVVYRTRKFALRYRWAVGAGALVVLSLSGGVVTTSWQAARASAERDRAEEEARKAGRVSSLMVELFRLSDPAMALGQTITAREVLDRGTERIERELVDEPDVQADLLGGVARVYANLGLLERAETLARRSLSLRTRMFGAGSPQAAESLALLADLVADLGRREEAVGLYRRAIAVREGLAEEGDTTLARVRTRLAWEIRADGDDEESARLFEAALATQRAVLGEAHPEVASTLLGLAATLHDRGRIAEAEELFQRVLERPDSAVEARSSPVVASALLNVGMIRRLREQYQEAEPLVRAGLDMREEMYDPAHPEVVEALAEWGAELYELGRYREAERAYVEGLRRASGVLDPSHPIVEGLREGLAEVLTALGRYGDASAGYNSVVASRSARYGRDDPRVTATLTAHGRTLLLAGRLDEARLRLQEALEMEDRLSPPADARRVLTLDGLARLALAEGKPDEAEQRLAEAQALAGRLLRPGQRWTLELGRTDAALRLARGDAAGAEQALRPVLAAEAAVRPEPHRRLALTLALVGRARLAGGDLLGARDALYRARANQTGLPPGHPEVRDVEALLRVVLAQDIVGGGVPPR